MDVEGKLRLKLRGVDVLAVEAVRHPLRKLHARHRLCREAARVIDHELAAVCLLVVHICRQVSVILTCTKNLTL